MGRWGELKAIHQEIGGVRLLLGRVYTIPQTDQHIRGDGSLDYRSKQLQEHLPDSDVQISGLRSFSCFRQVVQPHFSQVLREEVKRMIEYGKDRLQDETWQ